MLCGGCESFESGHAIFESGKAGREAQNGLAASPENIGLMDEGPRIRRGPHAGQARSLRQPRSDGSLHLVRALVDRIGRVVTDIVDRFGFRIECILASVGRGIVGHFLKRFSAFVADILYRVGAFFERIAHFLTLGIGPAGGQQGNGGYGGGDQQSHI